MELNELRFIGKSLVGLDCGTSKMKQTLQPKREGLT